MAVSILGILVLGNETLQERYNDKASRSSGIQVMKYLFLIMVWVLSFVTIVATEYSPFIYFQF